MQGTKQNFAGFPPVPEGHTRVFLNRSFGIGRGPLKGPGWSDVPDSWLPTIEAQPDLVRTDMAGRPLDDTVAASAAGPRATVDAGAVIPHPARTADSDKDSDDGGELVNPDEPTNPRADHAARIAEAAEGERTGGESIGETGSHLDTSRTLNPQPGQFSTDASHVAQLETERARATATASQRTATGAPAGATGAAGAGTTTGTGATAKTDAAADEGPKPATKTALRKIGIDDLRALAAAKGVKLKDDDDKEAVIDKLYDARVSLDD